MDIIYGLAPLQSLSVRPCVLPLIVRKESLSNLQHPFSRKVDGAFSHNALFISIYTQSITYINKTPLKVI